MPDWKEGKEEQRQIIFNKTLFPASKITFLFHQACHAFACKSL